MGPKTEELTEVLKKIISVLDKYEEKNWNTLIKKAYSCILNSDFYGIELLISAYGGMGSFNDLIIGQSYINGVFSWKPGACEANTELDELRSKAYNLAYDIKREVNTTKD
jgi:hypothetical protein